MVTYIPTTGVYTRRGKMSIVKANCRRYRKSRKKLKSQMLDELSSMLHLNRKYLSFLLRKVGKPIYTPQGLKIIGDDQISYTSLRGRKKIYTRELLPYLITIWRLAGGISSVHLVAFIKANEDIIFSHPRLKNLPAKIRNRLKHISHATIDRMLRPLRDKLRPYHHKATPQSSSLKKKIPVQPYYDKPKDELGYLEVDLVHHCGESSKGDFAYTLVATEITTDWTELRTIKNKAQIWTVKALKEIIATVPFRVSALHSDNGSAFINNHLYRFTQKHKISFTRSRDYHKNDAPYVESKNYSRVRRYTGYRRYDTERELLILQELMRLVSLKHNLFIPTMKLQSKYRLGAKVHKRYDIAIPYQRLMSSQRLSEDTKHHLIQLRNSTDYFKLINKIGHLEETLDHANQSKYHQRGSS